MAKVILAVDDSPSIRQMVSLTLSGAGYRIVEATDGAEALQYARSNPVDLVLADINMPNMDGITLIAHLRTLPAYRFTPLLLLTTESSPERKKDAKIAGATGWMIKPFQPEQLLNTIGRLLSQPTAP